MYLFSHSHILMYSFSHSQTKLVSPSPSLLLVETVREVGRVGTGKMNEDDRLDLPGTCAEGGGG